MDVLTFPSLLGPDDVLTYAEAAAFMRVDVRTIKRYVHKGLLETIGGPSKVFVTKRSIAAFQERTRRGGPFHGGDDAEA